MPETATTSVRGPRRRVHELKLPNGKVLVPRADVAKEGATDERTIRRLPIDTYYIAGVAYVEHDQAIDAIAHKHVRRRSQPQTKRRAVR